MESIEMEMLEDMHMQVSLALSKNCIAIDARRNSGRALKFVAGILNNVILEDYDPCATDAVPVILTYFDRKKHYSSEKENTLALLAIQAVCKTQLLQKQGIQLSDFSSIFEVLTRIDNEHEIFAEGDN